MEPFKFPLPPTDQDFEALIEQLNRNRHPNANVQRFGRNGQSQHGVDVLLTRADGTSDGYQCKHVAALSDDDIFSEATKARSFPEGLSRFIIYTTLPRDTGHQLAARTATARHPFLVIVSSWDDIAVDMMNDLEASRQYMRELPIHDLAEAYMRQLAIVFDRPAFTEPADMEWSHRAQLKAIVDTQQFLSTGELNTRDVRFVLRSLPAREITTIRSSITPIRKGLIDLKRAVTPAARAEAASDYPMALRLGQLADPLRIDLMNEVNTAIIASRQSPISFL